MNILKYFSKEKKQIEIINFEKLFILMGLYKTENNKKVSILKQFDYLGGENKHRTRFSKCLIEITDYGYIERFKVPYNFTKEDIEGLKDKLELHTNKSIDIDYYYSSLGAYFDIKVYNHKLKERYKFELIEPKEKDKLIVNLGYGRLGLIDFEINKHIGLFGESGSGKSTLSKCILTQLVLNYSPKELKLYLSDNKGGTELNIYANIEHTQAFTKNLKGLKQIFKTLNDEAEKRYKLLFDNELANISEYNMEFKENKLPNILFVIEEYAAVFKDNSIKNMLQLALSQWRSIGIYILITTQRPSASILSGELKCNLGTILGLKTLDSVNSNIVIDKYNLLNNLRGKGHGYIRRDGILEEFQAFDIDHATVKKMIKHLIVKKEYVELENNNIIQVEDKKNEGYNNNLDNKNNKGEVDNLDFLNSI